MLYVSTVRSILSLLLYTVFDHGPVHLYRAKKEEISTIYTVFMKNLSAEARNELFTRFFFFTESIYRLYAHCALYDLPRFYTFYTIFS